MFSVVDVIGKRLQDWLKVKARLYIDIVQPQTPSIHQECMFFSFVPCIFSMLCTSVAYHHNGYNSRSLTEISCTYSRGEREKRKIDLFQSVRFVNASFFFCGLPF